MSSLPGRLALLSGIVAFCAAEMLLLLRDAPPLGSLKRAALCAGLLFALVWVCARVALSVLREGTKRRSENR